MKWFVALCAVLACRDDIPLPDPFTGLVQVSGKSPFAPSCEAGSGEVATGLEVEPQLVADPNDDLHLVGAWQQDRWSTGGANGLVAGVSHDGGKTWTTSQAAFSGCEGGSEGRASDPWVAITPNGTVYASALVFDPDGATSQMAAALSTDGGATWQPPVVVIDDDDFDIFNDKESITADPTMPDTAYMVWDRLTGVTEPTQPIGTGPATLAIATAGVWDAPRPIFDPGSNAQTIGNVIAVLSDGTLLDVTDVITMLSSNNPTTTAAVIRSTDHGTTWSTPVTIAVMSPHDLVDPKTGLGIRTGAVLPQVAVDRTTDRVYVGWETFGSAAEGIVVTSSADGGMTWSTPVRVDPPTSNAWCATIAALPDGTVGAMYYDDRDDPPGDMGPFDVAVFLATSVDGGATWAEQRMTKPFDMTNATVGDEELFLGDYEGLASTGSAGFVPFFAVASQSEDTDDPGDIYVRPEGATATAGSATAMRGYRPGSPRHRRASATSAR